MPRRLHPVRLPAGPPSAPSLAVLLVLVLLAAAPAAAIAPWPLLNGGPLNTGRVDRGCPAKPFAFQFQSPKAESAPGYTSMAADSRRLYFSFDNTSASTAANGAASHPVLHALDLDQGGKLLWTWTPPGGGAAALSTNLLLVGAGDVVITSYFSDFESKNRQVVVVGVAAATGQQLWQHSLVLPYGWLYPCSPLPAALDASGELLVMASVTNQSAFGVSASQLTAIAIATGEQKWSAAVDDYVFWLGANSDGVHAMAFRALRSFDVASGAAQWTANYSQPTADVCAGGYSLAVPGRLAITVPSASGMTNYISIYDSRNGQMGTGIALPSFGAVVGFAPLQLVGQDTLVMATPANNCEMLAWNITDGSKISRTDNVLPCGNLQFFLNAIGPADQTQSQPAFLASRSWSTSSRLYVPEYVVSLDGSPVANFTEPACGPNTLPRPITFAQPATAATATRPCHCLAHHGQPVGLFGAYVVCYTEDSTWHCP